MWFLYWGDWRILKWSLEDGDYSDGDPYAWDESC